MTRNDLKYFDDTENYLRVKSDTWLSFLIEVRLYIKHTDRTRTETAVLKSYL